MPVDIETIASEVLAALEAGRQIPSLSARHPDLDLD